MDTLWVRVLLFLRQHLFLVMIIVIPGLTAMSTTKYGTMSDSNLHTLGTLVLSLVSIWRLFLLSDAFLMTCPSYLAIMECYLYIVLKWYIAYYNYVELMRVVYPMTSTGTPSIPFPSLWRWMTGLAIPSIGSSIFCSLRSTRYSVSLTDCAHFMTNLLKRPVVWITDTVMNREGYTLRTSNAKEAFC